MANDSASIKFVLMSTGDNSGSWGLISNDNWERVEQALYRFKSIDIANDDYTLTDNNTVNADTRNFRIELTSDEAISQDRTITLPPYNALPTTTGNNWIFKNSTDGDLIFTCSGVIGGDTVTLKPDEERWIAANQGGVSIILTPGNQFEDITFGTANNIAGQNMSIISDAGLLIQGSGGSAVQDVTGQLGLVAGTTMPISSSGTMTLTNSTSGNNITIKEDGIDMVSNGNIKKELTDALTHTLLKQDNVDGIVGQKSVGRITVPIDAADPPVISAEDFPNNSVSAIFTGSWFKAAGAAFFDDDVNAVLVLNVSDDAPTAIGDGYSLRLTMPVAPGPVYLTITHEADNASLVFTGELMLMTGSDVQNNGQGEFKDVLRVDNSNTAANVSIDFVEVDTVPRINFNRATADYAAAIALIEGGIEIATLQQAGERRSINYRFNSEGFIVDGTSDVNQVPITNFEIGFRDEDKALKIEGDQVLMPYKPAFLVRAGTAVASGRRNYGQALAKMIFQNFQLDACYDKGDNYNDGLSRFVAPIGGLYSFSFHSNLDEYAAQCYFTFFKNGATTGVRVSTNGEPFVDSNPSMSVHFQLEENDYIEMYIQPLNGNAPLDEVSTFFSGALIG